MRIHALAAAALAGAALTLTAAGIASGDPYDSLETGLTSCGRFSQPLKDAEHVQVGAAVWAGTRKQMYERDFGNVPTGGNPANDYEQWQIALARYNQTKVNTNAVYASENKRLCG